MNMKQYQQLKKMSKRQLFSQFSSFSSRALPVSHTKKVKRCIWFLLSSWFFMMSCAPIEEAVEPLPRPALRADCEVIFYSYDEQLLIDNGTLATIQYGDLNLSMRCTEVHVKQAMRRAACAVGGNSIMVLKQQGPDLWSRCYQATAQVFWLEPKAKIKVKDKLH